MITLHTTDGPARSSWWGRPIEDCFRDQVRLRPGATAVVDGEEHFSYQELFARSVAVARGLVAVGVQRETLVGMAFERSAQAIVAMLGIVLAGGAYLPINPSYPARRIAQILRASGGHLVLCPSGGAAAIKSVAPAEVDVREIDEVMAHGGDPHEFASPAVPAGRSPLAYVMYTSGSTGEPKGVMVEHAGILRLVKDTDYIDFSPANRVLHAAALEFDASTLEVWGALLNGARLCVVDQETTVVPARFAAALRENGITTCWLTAPLFHQIVDEDPDILAPLRTLVTGGDVVSPDHVCRARARNPRLRIYNGYGPTENTTFTTVFPIEQDPDGPIPIGRPIPGTTVLVCGEDGKPMPSGVVGELYTGGLGLARGFLNQPELTRQRFVVIDGEQYYRTGDRVHMDADGLLHFHGRLDDQVKIRGNLVETKEVTAALMAVPGVVDAYVRVIGASRTDRTLVAWVVAPNLTERAIRNALREALPGYMWPDHVVRLERLPLNSSGKVDWRTLPQPSQSDSQGGADLSPEQQRLAEIWSEVLGLSVEAIGPDDSFFDLGGNSLRLGVVLGRIGARLGVRLSFADAFTARTLDAMSDAIIATTSTAPPAIPTAAPDRPADLHPQQRSLYAIWRANPESVAYNIPFRLDIRGPLRWERLRAALSEVVAQHDALRMRFILDGDDVRQEPMGAVEPWFEYRDGASGEAVESFVRPFHPDEVPAPRALLVQLSPDRHALYLDVHHIVFDGVSLRLLVDELLDRYAGTFLPKPPVRYVDAAQWCHDRLASGAEQPDESYWLKQFTDVPPALALPTDHPRGSRRAVCGSVIRRELDAGWIGRVVAAARRHRTTEFASLLAAYVAVLGRLTGQRDITVGSPVSGRVHPDFDAVIGMFVSTVCLRIHLDAESTMADLSAQVDKCSREALSHQSYPFERLVKQVAGARDPARNPLFDAFFALQNIEFYEFRKHDLDVSVELLNPGTTRFDLNLQAYLRPDRLVLDLEYATELFERSSADYILDQYLAVLTELVDSPGSPVYRAAIGTSMTSCPDFDF